MIAMFAGCAFVLIATFILGYAVCLVLQPDPKYIPRHSPEVLKIQPREDTLSARTVPFTVGSAGLAA